MRLLVMMKIGKMIGIGLIIIIIMIVIIIIINTIIIIIIIILFCMSFLSPSSA